MSITIVFPVPDRLKKKNRIVNRFKQQTSYIKKSLNETNVLFYVSLTNISVDVVTFWGLWFGEKLKDIHKERNRCRSTASKTSAAMFLQYQKAPFDEKHVLFSLVFIYVFLCS